MGSLNQVSKSRFHGLWALTNRELKKWYKAPFLLLMAIIQPVIWIGLFGKAMNIQAIFSSSPTSLPPPPDIPPQYLPALQEWIANISNQMFQGAFGTSDYFSFMAIGMLSFVIMFATMFSGMSIVWDRRLGFLNKVLSTPVARASIVLSKVLSTVIRALIQASIVLIVAYLLGLQFGADFRLWNLFGVFAALFLMSIGFSSLFIMIAIRSTRWETHMAVMNLLNLPLLFTSNSLFPTSYMPDWLQTVTKINPITYTTDAVRQLTLFATDMQQLTLDFTFLGIFAAVFTTIGILLSWKYLSR